MLQSPTGMREPSLKKKIRPSVAGCCLKKGLHCDRQDKMSVLLINQNGASHFLLIHNFETGFKGVQACPHGKKIA